MAKWIYIDAREKNLNLERAVKIYMDNINAFSLGTFTEPGTESKNSFSKYLDDFNLLIDDIKINGFNENISLVPVGEDNIILDGSHRTAAAAYYDKNVTVIYFPGMRRQWDYNFFRQRLMSDINMGFMASSYTSVKDNLYMACLWPRTGLRLADKVQDILLKAGNILYSQDIYLTFNGIKNFMANIYSHDSWVGTEANNFAGAAGKARACFDKNYPVRTFLFQAHSSELVLECKQRIRDLYNIEKSSVHISDGQAETEMMCRILYDPENLHVINFTQNYIYGRNYNLPDSSLEKTLPKRYRPSRVQERLDYQIQRCRYSQGPLSEMSYCLRHVINPARKIYNLTRRIKRRLIKLISGGIK